MPATSVISILRGVLRATPSRRAERGVRPRTSGAPACYLRWRRYGGAVGVATARAGHLGVPRGGSSDQEERPRGTRALLVACSLAPQPTCGTQELRPRRAPPLAIAAVSPGGVLRSPATDAVNLCPVSSRPSPCARLATSASKTCTWTVSGRCVGRYVAFGRYRWVSACVCRCR